MHNRKGQTILEYTVIFIIILGALIAMKDYIKRGIQGRWRTATDDFGEQYDPTALNSDMRYATQVNGQSVVQVTAGNQIIDGVMTPGQWTGRTDYANSVETTTKNMQVGN